MAKKKDNTLYWLTAIAAAIYLFKDKLFPAPIIAPPLPNPDPNNGGGNDTPTYHMGQAVYANSNSPTVLSPTNNILAGPFLPDQYIGAFMSNDPGMLYKIIYAGQVAFVMKNKVKII